jgi:hypothetical protein
MIHATIKNNEMPASASRATSVKIQDTLLVSWLMTRLANYCVAGEQPPIYCCHVRMLSIEAFSLLHGLNVGYSGASKLASFTVCTVLKHYMPWRLAYPYLHRKTVFPRIPANTHRYVAGQPLQISVRVVRRPQKCHSCVTNSIICLSIVCHRMYVLLAAECWRGFGGRLLLVLPCKRSLEPSRSINSDSGGTPCLCR